MRREQSVPTRLSDVVHDDVDAAFAGALADCAHDVNSVSIEQDVGAQLRGAAKLVVASRHHPGSRADLLADLQRGKRDPATDSPDQYIFARLHPGARYDHSPRCHCRQGERSGHVERNRRSNRPHIRRRHYEVFGDRPRDVFTQHRESRAERLFSVETVLACSVAQTAVYHHVIADADRGDFGSDCVDDAARVRPQHPGRRDSYTGKSGDDKQIETVECRSANANANVARPSQVGDWEVVAKLETIEPAMTGDRECLHEVPAGAVILRPLGKLAGSRRLLASGHAQSDSEFIA